MLGGGMLADANGQRMVEIAHDVLAEALSVPKRSELRPLEHVRIALATYVDTGGQPYAGRGLDPR